jgi:hypothetical protein
MYFTRNMRLTACNPHIPLKVEARAAIEPRVNRVYAMLTGVVAQSRRV